MTNEGLLDILNKSQITNIDLKLSGLLVLYNNKFMQLLEGGKKEVTELYTIIGNDPRHTDVKTVFEAHSPERSMPTWAMAFSILGHDADTISEQAFYIPIEVTRKICSLMEGEVGKLFNQFLNA